MALAKEECLAKLISNFGTNSRKVSKQKKTRGYFIARRQLLGDYWARYNAAVDDVAGLVTTTDGDAAAVKAVLDGTRFEQIEAAYCEALGELNDSIDEIMVADKSETQCSVDHTLTCPNNSVKTILPKIEIPKFDGSFQLWMNFKDMFNTCVIKEESLSNVQRMHYLKSSLQGEAAAVLRNLNVTEQNFQIAWDMLQQRYDNKRRLVKSFMRDIVKLPTMQVESAAVMQKMMDCVTESIRALKQLGRPTEHWDDWIVFIITDRMDPVTVRDWEMSLDSTSVLPTLQELMSFLEIRIQGLEAVISASKSKPKEASKVQTPQSIRNHQTNIGRCQICSGKHSLMYCPSFKARSAQEKLDFVLKTKLCKNCLKSNHTLSDCKSTYACQRCKQKHHSLLHDSLEDQYNGVTMHHARMTRTFQQQQRKSENPCAGFTSVLLATALIGVKSTAGHYLQLRALLDNGSQASFISEFAAQQLHLRKTRVQIPVIGVGGSSVGKSTGLVEFSLTSLTEPHFSIACSALILPRLGHLLPNQRVALEPYEEFLGLTLADPNFYEPGSIDVIIGADIYGLLLRGEIMQATRSATTAQNTHLGWVICGRSVKESTLQLKTTVCATTHIELNNLVEQMWKFNELDDIEPTSKLTIDEQFCETFFEKTVVRLNSGRYQVRYPFKESCNLRLLADSKEDALKLFATQQKRLQSDPAMNKLYEDFMAEYLNIGHMEPVVLDTKNSPVCYIPHHGVYKESSSTTKLRTVFNAARKYKSGISLNDCLHVGPKMQNNLCSIILNWRMHRVAFMADIEKCYRQIRVHSADADMQRIVWHDDQGAPCIYRLLTVTYGLNCSPYLTIKVLHTLAANEEKNFPAASKVLREAFYMDDCLYGADTVEAALSLQGQLQQLLHSGGFVLRKWNSNSAAFMQRLNVDLILNKESCCDLNLDRETKALGIYWFCDSDSIGYKVNVTQATGPVTKRQQLSDVAKIYDPPGLLAPVVITGKSISQKLWLSGCGWDDHLPEPFQLEWQKFRSELTQVECIRIPRWVGAGPASSNYQLHVFADASTAAYAAVAYLRTETMQGEIIISILMAKTKVAPLKKITVPCLELNGALLAAKVAAKIQRTLQLPSLQIYCWSDSKTTLSWIRSSPGNHKQYISNRVTQIQELTAIDVWKYVPTKTNPADVASRGVFPSQLAGLEIWWKGPPWLSEKKESWPDQHIIVSVNKEGGIVSLLSTPKSIRNAFMEDLLSKFSNINTLLAVTAWCQRFTDAALNRPHDTTSYTTAAERATSLKFWIRKPLNSQSKLLKLNPMLDEEGILRLNGRLQNSELSPTEQCPTILPKDDQISALLIAQSHEVTLHGGVQVTLNQLRRRFWLIGARSSVKRFIHRCLKCFRQRCSAATQIMGSLPKHRCTAAKAFSHCGLDYGGPYQIRTTKGRGHHAYKGYVALFVCFSTRAVHLELVSDLTTDTFLAALRRFFAQRGYSSDIYSDCATTFMGANTILKEDFTAFRKQLEEAARVVSCHGVTWHFIPPGSPNFGGIWEAGIKSMKHHLKRVVGEATLTFEEFYTILKQIEAVMNSRPLSAISDDPSDLTALTPGHFLVGGPLIAVPEPTLLDLKTSRLKRWKQLQQMQQDFWRRWSCEYLQELNVRRKWNQPQNNLKVDDLVLVRDERAPPSQWSMGRIIEVHPGTDGIVRVATVRTQSSTLKRAISKLAVLPLQDDRSP